MINDKKNKKYQIWKTTYNNRFVIVIPASHFRGDFSKFKDRLNIKKLSDDVLDRSIKEPEHESYENLSNIIEFDNEYIDDDFIDKFIDHCNHLLFEIDDCTYFDAFMKTFSYFNNIITESTKKELQGDLGEAIFILKAREIGIDALKILRSSDESTYDFYSENGLCIDIKTATKAKNEIVISLKQNEAAKKKIFVVVKLDLIEKGKTILDLYEQIGLQYLPKLLQEKKIKWKNNIEIVEKITIRDELYSINLLDAEAIPTYTVWENKSLKKINFYIDVTDNLDKFENLKNILVS